VQTLHQGAKEIGAAYDASVVPRRVR